MKYIITGGQGFIGINLAKYLLTKHHHVMTIDKMSYASNPNIFKKNKRFLLKKIDICKAKEIKKLFFKFQPDVIFHLAAESHVDNSILNSEPFIKSNIVGTYSILKTFHEYQMSINPKSLLINVSTDEVFGSIKRGEFTENSKYLPNSPYSASKAAADHLARAWNKTFKTRVITTNCSNNFGPYQNNEKLIIYSKEAIFNKENFKTTFSKNVKLVYREQILESDILEFLIDKNIAIFRDNVKYQNQNIEAFSDIVVINLLTKEIDIKSKNQKKIRIKKNN